MTPLRLNRQPGSEGPVQFAVDGRPADRAQALNDLGDFLRTLAKTVEDPQSEGLAVGYLCADGEESTSTARRAGEVDSLGWSMVGYDSPLGEAILILGFVWSGKEQLGTGVAEKCPSAGYSILRTLEGVVAPRFRGMMSAQDGAAPALREPIDANEFGRVEVVLVSVNPCEDQDGVNDDERMPPCRELPQQGVNHVE